MAMKKQTPVNIRVKFGNEYAFLKNAESIFVTQDGVKIWIKSRPGNNYQPMAEIPDGTLEKYKHCRPEIISCAWENK